MKIGTKQNLAGRTSAGIPASSVTVQVLMMKILNFDSCLRMKWKDEKKAEYITYSYRNSRCSYSTKDDRNRADMYCEVKFYPYHLYRAVKVYP